ncbi:myosin [Thraustotheca clavata]|uniref:Myosin n=1 Tax=Thraustotheca clavata TaxID=74557 RepID=A0A1W0A983_9STRA|nr:myosin [Thraustotheca clavata]
MVAMERRVVGVDDMVLLPSVSDTGILENLKARHGSDQIYTFIGHVLVCVNPYKWLDIYNEQTMRYYAHKQRIDVPPHVFATAEETYRTMVREEENQCVIISGESGAGKTEASKQIQNYIAGISGSGAGVDKIKRTFLESNPLLEAFGNAKTVRNNNSSRFGKYFELLFDQAGRPQGGNVTNYLLEKSRVVKPGKAERNFHIFYQVLAGLPQGALEKFALSSDPRDYHYLNVSKCFNIDDIDDIVEFEATTQAMQHVGIKKKQIELVIQTIAAILHLGNVEFEPLQVKDAEGSRMHPSTATSLANACALLGLDVDAMEHAFSYKWLHTMAPGGKIESYEVPQNPDQARSQRDAIAKHIYECLFDFLVERVNHALDIEKQMDKDDASSIGILDIYGFEIFDMNGFEQFCINYVNEKLQQIFIELTLQSEQAEYAQEGITWTPIPFFNNKVVCDLIEARNPPGIFYILDDTIKTMHSRQGDSVDATFLDKLTSVHKGHPHFSKRGRVFEIKHYAGNVQYNIMGFGEANKESLTKDILGILQQSSNKLMQYLFGDIDTDESKKPITAGTKIRTQCAALVTALMDCQPHYVRCIKSNDNKQANHVDDKRVLHQIQYLGLLENVKVRRAGYAYRGDYGRFLDRFKWLSKETSGDFRGSDGNGAKAIIKAAIKHIPALKDEVQWGKSMVFIRSPETYFALELLRDTTFGHYVVKIQRAWIKYSSRRHLLALSADIAKLYNSKGKGRQRVSLYRPFDNDYCRANDVRNGVLDILRYYGDPEKIIFWDKIEKIGAQGQRNPRQLVVTADYLYLFEEYVAPAIPPNNKATYKPLPFISLRRRVPFAAIESIVLSPSADPFIVLRMTPPPILATPDNSHWKENKSTPVCMQTNKKFGLFTRRHHCRVTGNIYCAEVCSQLSVVPDRGYYNPVRVVDSVIGFFSTEMIEDQLWICEKKTELAVLLVNANKSIRIDFESTVSLRTSSVLSSSPSVPVQFSIGNDLSVNFMGQSINATAASWDQVPEKYVKARRKRERERKKKRDAEREVEMATRATRQAQREKEREEERHRRVAEKKARKQQEKDAKMALRSSSSKSMNSNVRQFGEVTTPSTGSNVNSELAAILARRRNQG